MNTRKIDHLVYCVPDLGKSMQELSELMGAKIFYGGQHQTLGTHNALLNLGNGAYLELLAIDEKNTAIPPPRWMGIDFFEKAMITRWAIKSNDLASDVAILKKANPKMGEVFAGSRKRADGTLLSWEMVKPLATPVVEILPFMVNWKGSVHPTQSLPDICKLVEIRAIHPQPDMMASTLNSLNVAIELKLGKVASLQAIIETPNGVILL